MTRPKHIDERAWTQLVERFNRAWKQDRKYFPLSHSPDDSVLARLDKEMSFRICVALELDRSTPRRRQIRMELTANEELLP